MSTLTDKKEIATITLLNEYKSRGVVSFPAVLSIPAAQRLPKLMENDYAATLTCVAAGLTMFLESEGLSDGLSVSIADAILSTSAEDNLSIQDVLLFLQGVRAGKYGKFYGVPTPMSVMEKFEQYREARHAALLLIREEQHSQFKVQGRDVYLPVTETPGEVLSEGQLNAMVEQIEKTYGKQQE